MLHRFLLDRPGCTVQEAARGLDLDRRRLLRMLEPPATQKNVVVVHKGNRRHLLPRLPDVHSWWPQARLLRDDRVADMHSWIESEGACQQKHIEAFGRTSFGWRLSTTQHHLRVLEDADLVLSFRHNETTRWVHYRALPIHTTLRSLVEEGTIRLHEGTNTYTNKCQHFRC